MFRKLKDKLAEEMKSSPQRLQQFAIAAQAAVTSASSSISDISNNDLFSIADEGSDGSQKGAPVANFPNATPNMFRDVPLGPSPSSQNGDGTPTNPFESGTRPPPARTRKLSDCSTASDASFRLPAYESSGTAFHLQSDLDVSTSEMEDNAKGPPQLERVSKEHLYAAYRRSNEKYNKYRGRYTDLARHYRNLERENAKAKAVLVETQDKALRRISELREQCQLEQSAKAHLENELRIELDERNLKIESLNTKIKLLQTYTPNNVIVDSVESANLQQESKDIISEEPIEMNVANLISLEPNEKPPVELSDEIVHSSSIDNELLSKRATEIQNLNNKIQKLEQLLTKCKETIKTHKEKNTQLTSEIQIVSSSLEKMNNENEKLHNTIRDMEDVSAHLNELKNHNDDLQAKLDNFELSKATEFTAIQSEISNSKKEALSLMDEINMLKKREEENAISLAENKLSIHKELEMKENEIKKLKESINKTEIIVKNKEVSIVELKRQLNEFEKEKSSLNICLTEMSSVKSASEDLKQKIDELRHQIGESETKYGTLMEKLKCTELQLKQESDEKLAIIDRNNFLENRNKQLSDENVQSNKKIVDLEKELTTNNHDSAKDILKNENDILVEKYESLKLKFEELSETKKVLDGELESKSTMLDEFLQNLDAKKKESLEMNSNINNLKDELNRVQNEYQVLSESNENLIDELKKLKENDSEKITEYINKTQELESKLTKSSLLAEHQEKEITQRLESEMNIKLEESLMSIKQKLQEKQLQYETLEKNYAELNNSTSEPEIESKMKIDKLENENKMFDSKLNELALENSSLKNEIVAINSQYSQQKINVDHLETEKKERECKINEMLNEIEALQNELLSINTSHMQLVSEKNIIEEKISNIEKMKFDNDQEYSLSLASKERDIEKIDGLLESLKIENEALLKEKDELQKKVSNLEQVICESDIKIKEYSENNEVWQIKLSNILDDNNTLQEKCKRLKQDKENLQEQSSTLEQKCNDYDLLKKQLQEAKLEHEFLNMRVSQLDSDLKQVNNDKNKLSSDKNNLQIEFDHVSKEMTDLKSREIKFNTIIQEYAQGKEVLDNELAMKTVEREKLVSEIELYKESRKEFDELTMQKNMLETKLIALEREMNIKIDESKIDLENLNMQLESKNKELTEVSQMFSVTKLENENLNVRIRVLEQIELEHSKINEEILILKEENLKLTSNIEGLQTHLTTISKENSILNDQLREIRANGDVIQAVHLKNVESISKDTTTDTELTKLRKENDELIAQVNANEGLSNKLLDLERQNSVLIEEKLDLEDQLKSSTDKPSKEQNDWGKNVEVQKLESKINEILSEKMELESRLANIELINRSSDSNMKLLEQKNEKLGLTNEKLERRLDEALVSLNHIRNLEENTELEYLRNILYEYLTGPTNNNLILAKVLSAVVKFDHRQTQLVLERERERQGLLGQLGLL